MSTTASSFPPFICEPGVPLKKLYEYLNRNRSPKVQKPNEKTFCDYSQKNYDFDKKTVKIIFSRDECVTLTYDDLYVVTAVSCGWFAVYPTKPYVPLKLQPCNPSSSFPKKVKFKSGDAVGSLVNDIMMRKYTRTSHTYQQDAARIVDIFPVIVDSLDISYVGTLGNKYHLQLNLDNDSKIFPQDVLPCSFVAFHSDDYVAPSSSSSSTSTNETKQVSIPARSVLKVGDPMIYNLCTRDNFVKLWTSSDVYQLKQVKSWEPSTHSGKDSFVFAAFHSDGEKETVWITGKERRVDKIHSSSNDYCKIEFFESNPHCTFVESPRTVAPSSSSSSSISTNETKPARLALKAGDPMICKLSSGDNFVKLWTSSDVYQFKKVNLWARIVKPGISDYISISTGPNKTKEIVHIFEKNGCVDKINSTSNEYCKIEFFEYAPELAHESTQPQTADDDDDEDDDEDYEYDDEDYEEISDNEDDFDEFDDETQAELEKIKQSISTLEENKLEEQQKKIDEEQKKLDENKKKLKEEKEKLEKEKKTEIKKPTTKKKVDQRVLKLVQECVKLVYEKPEQARKFCAEGGVFYPFGKLSENTFDAYKFANEALFLLPKFKIAAHSHHGYWRFQMFLMD